TFGAFNVLVIDGLVLNLPMVRLMIGVVVGGVLGYGLYRLVGCSSGACPITSNPWVSTIFGMVIGGLSVGRF
ncbi:MAG: DUF6132 family protein, partial [bacterium]